MIIKKVVVLKNSKAVSKQAAELFIKEVMKKPDIVIGLPGGETFVPVYREVVKLYKKRKVSFVGVRVFNLDEFFGIISCDRRSIHNYMKRNLFEHVNLKEENIYFLEGLVEDWKKECSDYEQKIKSVGGIDLQFLGVGVNGHIGFNEPGSAFTSRTRKVKLTLPTRKINSKYFGSLEETPKEALTMGIGTILEAKKIVVAATGEHKAKATAAIASGKINKKFPCSVLARHSETTLLADEKAAAAI